MLLLMLFTCKAQEQENNSVEYINTQLDSVIEVTTFDEHTPTELPIRIDLLDERSKDVIKNGYKLDTTDGLLNSRPIMWQIQGVKNNDSQSRTPKRLIETTELFIYALGEAKDSVLVDYGWIENLDTKEIVWRMTFDKSEYAGGDGRNRKVVETIYLPSGNYTLKQKSNESHASDGWIGDPPEIPYYYGITVFNMKAVRIINKKLETANYHSVPKIKN